MKTVHILSEFTGYPNGKDKRLFAQGDEVELADAYADLLVGKGLAREAADDSATPKGRPAKKKD